MVVLPLMLRIVHRGTAEFDGEIAAKPYMTSHYQEQNGEARERAECEDAPRQFFMVISIENQYELGKSGDCKKTGLFIAGCNLTLHTCIL